MSARKVIKIGDPPLKTKNLSISDFESAPFKKLVQDLKDTMKKEDLIGIAAPQIGENFCVFVTQPRRTKARNLGKIDEVRVYVNPEITFYSKKKNLIYEGCGCVPDLFGPVIRPEEITIEAFNEKGQKFRLTSNGLLACVIQHEYDHLSGIEFIEKISDYQKILFKDQYTKRIRNSKKQITASKITKFIYQKII